MRVRGSDKRTRKLMTLVNDDDFQERLRMAVSDPTGQEAHKKTKIVLPFLKIVGSKVRWSSFERSNALTYLYAMNQFFGLSFLFVFYLYQCATHHLRYGCVTAPRILTWNYPT